MQKLAQIDVNMPPAEIMQQPGFLVGIWLSLVSFVFLIWALVWMFQALKVSCNLKGYRLVILYCVGVLLMEQQIAQSGDILYDIVRPGLR